MTDFRRYRHVRIRPVKLSKLIFRFPVQLQSRRLQSRRSEIVPGLRTIDTRLQNGVLSLIVGAYFLQPTIILEPSKDMSGSQVVRNVSSILCRMGIRRSGKKSVSSERERERCGPKKLHKKASYPLIPISIPKRQSRIPAYNPFSEHTSSSPPQNHLHTSPTKSPASKSNPKCIPPSFLS